jgi:ankyrin repeat protein
MEEAEERIGNFIEYLNRTGIEITKSSPIPVLHWAAAYGSPLLVTKLISAGASLHLRDLSHGTPLHSAALNGQFQVVKLLMQLGSDVNARNLYGFTALHYAVMSGCVKTTMTLLEDDNGIEIDAKSQNGYTPLYAAAHNGRLTIVQMLLKHGADINNRDEDGNSALITAADTGHVDVVCWLMQNIKHINTKPNIANDTPLNVAARDGSIETVRCLLENGFPANEPEDVTSSLAVAVEKGNLEVVKLLLKFGAEVNRKDKDGTTQLHKAVEKGNFKIVQVLIQHGADLLAVDKDGRTAEGIARRKKYHHIEEFLTNVRRNGGSNIKSSGNEDLD